MYGVLENVLRGDEMYKIKTNPKSGRGLYADREIFPGEPVMTCELIVLSEKDTITLQETDLKYYTFVFNDTQDCLLLGDGELFNHCDVPNVSFDLKRYKDRMVMYFKCVRHIEDGEELVINYNSDIIVKVDEYIAAPSLVGK